jgi:choline dehydrogenase
MSEKDSLHFDTIIVGAGTTGCVLAARLSEDSSRRVLVVEAGQDYGSLDQYPPHLKRSGSMQASMPGDPHAWSYMGQITNDVSYPVTRGKVVGGSSAVNGSQFTRGTPEDFAAWVRLGNDEWSYDKVLPYYLQLETDCDFPESELHGSNGPIRIVRAKRQELAPVSESFVDSCLDLGYPWDPDMNAPESTGVGITPFNVVDGVRQNTGGTYLDPSRRAKNLTVLPNTLVTRVLIENGVTVGIEALIDGRSERFFAPQVVLSAGGLNSPQLLLLSGIGPAESLRRLDIPVHQDAPGVGRNLLDHPAISVSYRLSNLTPTAEAARPNSQVLLNGSTGVDGDEEDMRIIAFCYPKFGMLFGTKGQSLRERASSAGFLMRPAATLKGLRGTSWRSLAHDVKHRSDTSLYCVIGKVEGRGQIELTSADPTAPLSISWNYLTTDADLRRVRRSVQMAREILEHKSFAKLGASITGPTNDEATSLSSLDGWIRSNINTAYHTSGTCHMGPESDHSAVVDQFGRVRGVEGLHVLDISIMPQQVRRGPNASAIMIGERGAEFLIKVGA